MIGIDRSASGALRITLDQVQLGKISKPRTPARIRLSLHGPPPEREPRIGDKLLTKGSVVPPQGPAEPGGFDFRRHAYFQGLGGVGYTRKAVELQNSDVTPLPFGLQNCAELCLHGSKQNCLSPWRDLQLPL